MTSIDSGLKRGAAAGKSGHFADVYASNGQAAVESFKVSLGDLKYMTLLFIAGLVLSVFAGALAKCAVEKIVSKKKNSKCGGGRCGEFGWSLVRKDSESCHALCAKCGWVSHFDIEKWREVGGNRRRHL
ncbi:MAG: hypothetical protein WBX20_18610 [Terrimicrobiaceae bacterium]